MLNAYEKQVLEDIETRLGADPELAALFGRDAPPAHRAPVGPVLTVGLLVLVVGDVLGSLAVVVVGVVLAVTALGMALLAGRDASRPAPPPGGLAAV